MNYYPKNYKAKEGVQGRGIGNSGPIVYLRQLPTKERVEETSHLLFAHYVLTIGYVGDGQRRRPTPFPFAEP